MIISFVLGGLGNQLFQYAVARKLSYVNNVPLKIEKFGYRFKKYKIHPYCLDEFNIKVGKVNALDYLRLAPKVLTQFPFTKEKSAAFDKNILEIKDNTILVGYWHSEKYFNDISEIIKSDITLKKPLDALSQSIADKITSTQSVSIHVRRSDYISNQKNVNIFETCSVEYYTEAIKLISQSVQSPHFFIFSDDHAWAKENIKINFPVTYVSHNDSNHSYIDLMLMRKCKHNIIANSTFSWWGAWLNDNPNKIIISPKKWFKDVKYDEPDLIPVSWIKL